jgi:hypothetical protein
MDPQSPAPPAAPKKKRGPLLIILIVVGVIVIAGIVAVVVKKSGDSGGSAGAPAGQATKGLYKAWQAGNANGAAKFATPSSVTYLFKVSPSDAAGLKFDGCTATGNDPFPKECEWSRPGGQLTMTVDKQGDKPIVTNVDYGPAGLPPDTTTTG